jgi:transcriptional regulator with XRE-family HTH domain
MRTKFLIEEATMFNLGKKEPNKRNVIFGSRIRQARDDKNWTQSQLAEEIGKRQESVSDLETGRTEVSASDLADIAVNVGKKITFFYEDFPPILPTLKLSHDEEDLISSYRKIQESALKKIARDKVRQLAEISIESDLEQQGREARRELAKIRARGGLKKYAPSRQK